MKKVLSEGNHLVKKLLYKGILLPSNETQVSQIYSFLGHAQRGAGATATSAADTACDWPCLGHGHLGAAGAGADSSLLKEAGGPAAAVTTGALAGCLRGHAQRGAA